MKKAVFIIFFALLSTALFLEFKRLTVKPWPATYFADDVANFKYGSIGAEVDGYPFSIWQELPALFADEIPGGFADFGFITEPGATLPVGVSVRRVGVPRVGFNCSTCHVSTYRLDGREQMVLGAPANALNIQAYITFLTNASQDPRLTAAAVIDSAQANDRSLGLLERLALQWVVFPRLEEEISGLSESLSWMSTRPAHGPGRTDAGNFWRERWGLEPANDIRVGTVDFPAVWNQRIRLNGWFHWDGNNESLEERNFSAALAGGAKEWLLERHAINRVSDWLMDLPPPQFPAPIDGDLATRGAQVYADAACGTCHDQGGKSFGEVTPNWTLQTDPQRTELFDADMVKYFRSVGALYSWRFSNYRATDGYANMPLDGVWMRAPYLHNGSVPTLADLLVPPAGRPATFYRGCTDLDVIRVGFVCDGGFLFDTSLTGNAASGHLYGTGLAEQDKVALLEYLKTL